MAFSFGGGINPQLGAQDFSAILRGAQNYSQSTAAGSAAIGQGIGNALAGLGEGLKLYKQNQEKSQMMLGELQNIIRNDESAIKDVDPKILKQVESGDIRFKDLSQAYANVMTGQKMKAARQAAQDQKSIAVGLSALRYGNDPLAAVQGTGNAVTPGVVNFFSQLSTMQAEREKTQAETAKLRADSAGSPMDALTYRRKQLEVEKLQRELAALGQPEKMTPYQTASLNLKREEMATAATEKATNAAEAQAKDAERAASAKADIAQALQTVGEAIQLSRGSAGGPIAGLPIVRDIAAIHGSTGAKVLNSKYNTIKAVMKLQKLQEMKELSRNSASGLGQLSDREGAALESAIAELDPTLPESTQLANLQKIQGYLTRLASGPTVKLSSKALKYLPAE